MRTLLLAVFLFSGINAQSQAQAIFTPSATHNAVISFPYSNVNSEVNPVDLVAAYWTGNGTQGAWRSFFKVDMSSISPNAIIDSAYFTLYANTASVYGNAGQPNFGVQNSAYICKVTAAWNTNQFNWNNQPTFTTINAAVIDQSIATVQDYLHVDATNLIQDAVTGTNNGFALVLQNEMSYYDSQIFHSSSSSNASKRPTLTVYYRYPLDVTDVSSEDKLCSYFQVSDLLKLDFKNEFSGKVSIFNTTGALVKKINTNATKHLQISTSQLSSGIYFVEVSNNTSRNVFKIAL